VESHKHLTTPTRCQECQQPMDSPIACSTCGAFTQRSPDTFNYFELFGLKRNYEIDLNILHQKFLIMSRIIHPDMSSQSPTDRRQKALSLSAKVNRAYDTLHDPLARAEYLLSLTGGPDPSKDKTVPKDLLGQVLLLREELDEAIEASDADALQMLKRNISECYDQTLRRIAELASALNETDLENRKNLRVELNTIKYWKNLLDQMPPSTAG